MRNGNGKKDHRRNVELRVEEPASVIIDFAMVSDTGSILGRPMLKVTMDPATRLVVDATVDVELPQP